MQSTLRAETTTNRAETTNEADHTNPLQADGLTNDHRALLLEAWTDAIEARFGVTPLLMPRGDDKQPAIVGRCGLDTDEARNLLVKPDEAARRIRQNGETGFYVYAGRDDHQTEYLAITDHDDLDRYPPDTHNPTLRVMSGSGSFHNYYRNDSDDPVANADIPDGGGEIHAHNRGVVVPGSVHPSGGVYHVVANPGIATLADANLTDEQRPSLATHTLPDGFDAQDFDGDKPDQTDLGIAEDAVRSFYYEDGGTTHATRETYHDLMNGRGRKQGCKADDGSTDRSEEEFRLVGATYGIMRKHACVDDSRAADLATTWTTHCCRQQRHTTDGLPRKWLTTDESYRRATVAAAVRTFDRDTFENWQRKRDEWRRNGKYSQLTLHYVRFAVENLADADNRNYPIRQQVVTLARLLDDNPRANHTYRNALSRLQNRYGQLKRAKIAGMNQHVYIPTRAPDPPDAETVWLNGERQDSR